MFILDDDIFFLLNNFKIPQFIAPYFPVNPVILTRVFERASELFLIRSVVGALLFVILINACIYLSVMENSNCSFLSYALT